MTPTTPDAFLAAPLSDYRQVEVLMLGPTGPGATRTQLVHKDHVARFKAAMLELHYAPGVNPHNGGATTPVGEIRVYTLRTTGPYWHTTPGLTDNGNPAGAVLIETDAVVDLWTHPCLEAERRMAEARELAIEAALD